MSWARNSGFAPGPSYFFLSYADSECSIGSVPEAGLVAAAIDDDDFHDLSACANKINR